MCVVSGRKGPGRRFYASWLPGERCISRATVMMATEDVRGTYCQLLSGSCLHSPINLPDGTVVSVGREPKTKIKSKKCSRRQVSFLCLRVCKQTKSYVSKHQYLCIQRVHTPYLRTSSHHKDTTIPDFTHKQCATTLPNPTLLSNMRA